MNLNVQFIVTYGFFLKDWPPLSRLSCSFLWSSPWEIFGLMQNYSQSSNTFICASTQGPKFSSGWIGLGVHIIKLYRYNNTIYLFPTLPVAIPAFRHVARIPNEWKPAMEAFHGDFAPCLQEMGVHVCLWLLNWEFHDCLNPATPKVDAHKWFVMSRVHNSPPIIRRRCPQFRRNRQLLRFWYSKWEKVQISGAQLERNFAQLERNSAQLERNSENL